MTTSLRQCGDISLNVSEYGPENGRFVILLHGFPDFSLAWRHQIPALVAAGYRVIVPDQRGYNLSDKPKGVASYDLDRLAADVIALAESYGHDRFDVVGHDWGASVAWWLATYHADRLGRAVMINAPHPAIWRDAMRNDPRQRKLSGYVRILALPWLPELGLRAGNFKALAEGLTSSKVPPSAAELDAYRAAWGQPGALGGMVNWYRAMLRRKSLDIPRPNSLATPMLIVWGRDDAYAVPDLAERSAALGAYARLEFIDAAGHWAMWDQWRQVNALLLAFLAS